MTISSKEALGYLDDIAHGRKMNYDPHKFKEIVAEDLEVLEILKRAPFILETLFDNYEMPKEMEDRYFYGTISDAEVKKVKGWMER